MNGAGGNFGPPSLPTKRRPVVTPILSNRLYLPKERLSERIIKDLKKELTFIPRVMSSDEPQEPILLYKENADYFAVPVSTPEHLIPPEALEGLEVRVSYGHEVSFSKRPDPNHPSVRDPIAQRILMDGMLGACQDYFAFIAQAATGTGKTACALNTIAELGRNALVIVPTNALAEQWITSAKNLIGATDEQIGRIQADKLDYKNKAITIGVINSLAMKEYPKEVYSAFGIVVVDEAHRVASKVFSQALPRFNARYKIGLSATPKRKDGADKVLQYHLGGIHVKSEAEALFAKVYPVQYRTRQRLWGQNHGSRVKCLTLDRDRNNVIVGIVQRLYSEGRNILVVSDSINHLQELIRLSELSGIPSAKIGQFTGQVYLPDGKKRKVTNDELEYIETHSQVIMGTYSMIKEGVDIPRLDAGIDATPRTDAIQVVGRIRRPYPNKRIPVWYTIVDVASEAFRAYFYKRRKEYAQTNMEIVE